MERRSGMRWRGGGGLVGGWGALQEDDVMYLE